MSLIRMTFLAGFMSSVNHGLMKLSSGTLSVAAISSRCADVSFIFIHWTLILSNGLLCGYPDMLIVTKSC